MLVNAILKNIPDEDMIEQMLSISKPLQRLVQQHNRIAFVSDNINMITKDFTGAQLKKELEKHTPEVIIGLLHEYIDLIKIIVSLGNTDDNPKHDMQIKITKDSNSKSKVEVIETVDANSDELKSADRKNLKVFTIKIMVSLIAVCTLAIFGAILYISTHTDEQLDSEMVTSLFKTSLEIIKFLIVPPK